MLRRAGALAAACLVLSTPLPPVIAQTETPPTPPEAPSISAERPNAVPLSLADTLRAALENNLGLRVERVNPLVAEQDIELRTAPFDPAITAGASHEERTVEETSAFRNPETKIDSAQVSWADLTTHGIDYSVGYSATRTDSPPSSLLPPEFTEPNPIWDSGVTASVTVPLLRGSGREFNTLQIVIARADLEISREALAQQVNETLQAVETAYWALVAAGESLDVALQSRSLAQELLELNRRKVEVGTLAPIEITQAEAGVAEREEAVIVAEAARRDAEDRLRAFMAIPREDPRWRQPLQPTLQPEFQEEQVDVERRIEQALATRPELSSARRILRSRELSERVSRRQVRPSLDLTGTVAPAGNNVDVLPGPDGILGTIDDVDVVRGFGESVSEVPDFENYRWSVGLNFILPLRNREAKANAAIASLERQRAQLQIANLEQTVRVEVRTAGRGVTSGAERIAAARKNVELQERKLDAERKKFENGMSTSFEVLTFQTDLANAQLRLIQALIDYQVARAELERVTGTLLEARGMRFDSTTGR
jgi:outer membrane protein TolC